jgi:beta-lactamase class A
MFALILCAIVSSPYEAKLRPLVDQHAGKVAIALKNLKTGETWFHNADDSMPTASLIKVAILCELFAQVEEGKLKLTDPVTLRKEDKVPGAGVLTDNFSEGLSFPVLDAARLMITVSDNTATNLVIDKVTIPAINDRMAAWGYKYTRLNAKVFKGSTTSVAPEQTKKFGLGSTSARDMMELFAKLHAGEVVSKDASRQMLGILKLCQDNAMFRRFLANEKVAAHKTGATNAVRTSAGILITDAGPVAICILTAENKDQSWVPDNAAQVLIGKIAREVVILNSK